MILLQLWMRRQLECKDADDAARAIGSGPRSLLYLTSHLHLQNLGKKSVFFTFYNFTLSGAGIKEGTKQSLEKEGARPGIATKVVLSYSFVPLLFNGDLCTR